MRPCKSIAIAVIVLGVLLTGAGPARAGTLTVNSTADAVDANPGDGVCETAPGNGICTLRAAIQEANAQGVPGTIVLPAGVYTLSIAGQSSTGAAGDLDIAGNVTITGAGADTTIVQACVVDQKTAPCPSGQGIADRVFQVLPGAVATLNGVTVRHGYATSNSVGFAFGGGLRNAGTLTLTNSVVTLNRSDVHGGGICNGRSDATGTLTLNNTTVSDNSAAQQGGGIINAFFFGIPIGTMTLNGSTVANNTAANGGGIVSGTGSQPSGAVILNGSVVSGNRASSNSGAGGGILIQGGTLTVTNSTIAGNLATFGSGGGISHSGSDGTLTNSTVSGNTALGTGGGILSFTSLTITNSTISSNSTTNGNGGGIYNLGSVGLTLTDSTLSGNTAVGNGGGLASFGPGRVTLSNVTITNNAANNPFGGVGGGGIIGEAGSMTLKNTIIAGNLSNLGFPDCSSDTTVKSLGFNLIGDGTTCNGITPGANGDLVGTAAQPLAPLLAPLGNYGGPTQTHALLGGSPAIDAGNPSGCTDAVGEPLLTDQRGESRALDGNGDGVARCDIGAVEFRNIGTALALSGERPTHAGNSGSIVVLLYGSGFVDGMTARLRRSGQPDIVGAQVSIDGTGAAAATTLDLAGQAPGVWDVVVTNPDGTAATLAGSFTVEAGGAPQLWADVIVPKFRVGKPGTFFVIYGNRGNSDAFAVPLGLSAPSGFTVTKRSPVAPPPPQPGQVLADWSQVPIAARGAPTDPVAIPLVLPVVPAAFTGVLTFTLIAPQAGPFQLTLGIGSPYFQPALNPTVVDGFIQGAALYAQRVYGATTLAPLALRQDYVTNQLHAVVNQGVASLITSAGTSESVYSLSQLVIDDAQFAASQP